MTPSTTLVTGGAGFIGSQCVRALLARGEHVVVLDDLNDFYDPALKRKNLEEFLVHSAFTFVEGDIRDEAVLARVFAEWKPEKVLHLAARAGVRPSLAEPALYFDVNVTGTVRVLDAAHVAGVQHVVLASSSSVYGERDGAGAFKETDEIHETASPYAASKLAMEEYAEQWAARTGISTSCLRFFTVYGPGQRPDMAIRRFLEAVEKDEPITVYGDGTTRRDYTYIDDIVQGVLGALDRPHGFRIYNLGESRTIELNELLRIIEQATGKTFSITRAPRQPGDVSATFADITRAKEELGYDPKTPIEEGIAKTVAWLREKNEKSA